MVGSAQHEPYCSWLFTGIIALFCGSEGVVHELMVLTRIDRATVHKLPFSIRNGGLVVLGRRAQELVGAESDFKPRRATWRWQHLTKKKPKRCNSRPCKCPLCGEVVTCVSPHDVLLCKSMGVVHELTVATGIDCVIENELLLARRQQVVGGEEPCTFDVTYGRRHPPRATPVSLSFLTSWCLPQSDKLQWRWPVEHVQDIVT